MHLLILILIVLFFIHFTLPELALSGALKAMKWVYTLRIWLFARRRQKLLQALQQIKDDKQALATAEVECQTLLRTLETDEAAFRARAGRYISIED